MMPIGYYIPDSVERQLERLAALNGISSLTFDTNGQIRTRGGRLAFVLSNGFLESSFSLSDGEDMVFHAALTASGAKHAGAEPWKVWPRRFLFHLNKTISCDCLPSLLSREIAFIGTTENSAHFRFLNSTVILGVRTASDHSFTSFLAFERVSESSTELDPDWMFLRNALEEHGFYEVTRDELEHGQEKGTRRKRDGGEWH